MSILTDDTGCPAGCSTVGTELAPNRYTGGAGCGGGTEICTCDWPGDHTPPGTDSTVYFTDSAMVYDAATPGILKGATGDPTKCRDACEVDADCDFALFRFSPGKCHLWKLPPAFHAPGSTCNRKKWWVGSNPTSEGGINYVKGPLFVDAGWHVWPKSWFGNFSCHGRHAASAAHFDNCDVTVDGNNPLAYQHVTPEEWKPLSGVEEGFDFSLPPTIEPAPNGYLALQRSFDILPYPPYKWNQQWPNVGNPPGGPGASGLPKGLGFKANPVFSMWGTWKQFEPSEGVYDFSAIHENIAESERRGWHVAIRLLTSRVDEAATYLSGQSIATKYDGTNYDPSDPTFHSRYLALLTALSAEGFCQNATVVMMYVGYASSSYGDEYIGPSTSNNNNNVEAGSGGSGEAVDASDPASYDHVKERLDGWANVCTGATHKVLMGGESAYGTSLGFGTRNGFVEHYWYQLPDESYGQSLATSSFRDYIEVNASASTLLHPDLMLGEENEEYAAAWSSDWLTNEKQASGKGGAWDANASAYGGSSRYGPIASFPYRYLMSSLRSLQMRVSYMLASTVVVNPNLFAYVALELDRTADDAPDAWCFLATAHFWWVKQRMGPGYVANMERWLYQRDQPPTTQDGVVTFRDARVTQTPAQPTSNGSWYSNEPYDWIAKTAPRGKIGFTLDPGFAYAPSNPLSSGWIKVTAFDVLPGFLFITQEHLGGAEVVELGRAATVGDGKLKTFTFPIASLVVRDANAADSGFDFDFEICAEATAGGASQALVLSMVRVIKTPLESPPPPPMPPGAALVHKTVVEMTASGDVSDFDEAAKASLADSFAALAGVDASAVVVDISPASVIIVVTITQSDAAAASALVNTLSTTLSDAAAASAFTGLTVTSTPSLTVVQEIAEGAAPPVSSNLCAGGTLCLNLAAVFLSLAAILIAVLICWVWKAGKAKPGATDLGGVAAGPLPNLRVPPKDGKYDGPVVV